MNTSNHSDAPYLENNRPWYESIDGTCTFQEPTAIYMGDDKPLHLLYPVHWKEWFGVLAKANSLARELNALLVVMLYGDVSLDHMKFLVLEFAEARVIPIWIGEENRKKFASTVARYSSIQIYPQP
ncbi:MAG: hypothetical protein M3O33_09170 [Cyanobacteriota bacterium]|nr:hypothetical protein [Cyanobacteriota bacterium]